MIHTSSPTANHHVWAVAVMARLITPHGNIAIMHVYIIHACEDDIAQILRHGIPIKAATSGRTSAIEYILENYNSQDRMPEHSNA